MNNKNARLTPLGRERIVRQVESGRTPEAVSETAGICLRTVRKWVERARLKGANPANIPIWQERV